MKVLLCIRLSLLVALSLLGVIAGASANPSSPAPVAERPSSEILLILGGVGLLAALFGGKIRRSNRF
jgi:hypothetical protein